MRRLTVRGLDPELERVLHETARAAGSLNRAVLLLMRRGAGLEDSCRSTGVIGHIVDDFIGCLDAADARAVREAVAGLHVVDAELWR